jgi:hypothetical protein
MSSRSDTGLSPKSSIESSTQPPPQKKVSAKNACFVFPKKIGPAVKRVMEMSLSEIDVLCGQELLDELDGRMKISDVKNPIRYLESLKSRYLLGTFQLELGVQVKENRERLAERERSKNDVERNIDEKNVMRKSEPTIDFKNIILKYRAQK